MSRPTNFVVALDQPGGSRNLTGVEPTKRCSRPVCRPPPSRKFSFRNPEAQGRRGAGHFRAGSSRQTFHLGNQGRSITLLTLRLAPPAARVGPGPRRKRRLAKDRSTQKQEKAGTLESRRGTGDQGAEGANPRTGFREMPSTIPTPTK